MSAGFEQIKDLFASENGSADEMKAQVQSLAQDIVCALKEQAPTHSQELLSVLVSELFLSATKLTMKEERRKKQAEGIAKAKARGVKFGTRLRPLPDNFEQARLSWRNQEVNLKEAASLCGMPPSTFYDAVQRVERSAGK
jgi:DNA invertase Pin-like site-specific DNA recombinase